MRLLNGASDSDILERKLFFDWVLGIGDGKIGESNGVDIQLDIPSNLLISSIDLYQINNYMLDLILGEAKIYLSRDSPHSQNMDGDVIDNVHTLEFLNTIDTSGLAGWSPSDVVKEYRSKIRIMQ